MEWTTDAQSTMSMEEKRSPLLIEIEDEKHCILASPAGDYDGGVGGAVREVRGR